MGNARQRTGGRSPRSLRPLVVHGVVTAVLLVFGLSSPARAATVLEQVAANLPPGQWADITAQVGGSAAIGGVLETVPGSHINEYADKGAWNPATREAFFVGASHAAGEPGSAEKFVRYADATSSWSIAGPDVSPATYQAHSYQHNAINTANGDIYYRRYDSTEVYRFRGGAWSAMPAIPSGARQVAGALEVFPERNGMIFVDGDWGVWWFSYATNAWTLIKETSGGQGTNLGRFPMGPYHNVAVYNPVYKVVLFGGGNGSAALYKLDQGGTLSQETTAPVPVAVNSTIFTVDPASGDYLLFDNSARFWSYSPGTKAWAAMPLSQYPPFFSASADGPALGTVAFPITTYGVTMYTTWNHANSRVYLYKHAAGSGAPTPTPTATPIPGTTAPTVAPTALPPTPTVAPPLPSPTPPSTTGGLVLAMNFDEGAGSTVNDRSGYNNHGTVNGNAAWSPGGKHGGALVFDGIDDFVSVPDAASLDLAAAGTIEAWFKLGGTGTWRSILAKGSANSDAAHNYFIEFTNTDLVLHGIGNGLSNQSVLGAAFVETANFHHAAMTWDGSTITLYLDGAVARTTTQAIAPAANAAALFIGQFGGNVDRFKGLIDDVRVYRRALSAVEILADMNTPVGNTPPASDTTPPTVAITAPAGGTVSGTIVLAASAADNVGVAGVRFQVDGAAVGAEDSSPPYALNLDTTVLSNSAHAITAIARDAAGNTATSAAINVTVSNPTPSPAPSADFQTRCAAPGVIKCVDFDDAADIAGRWGNVSGILPGDNGSPAIDTAVRASGSGSLKFTIPGNAGNVAGSYFANFSDDLSQRFGEGEEFYVQWRQRIAPEFLTTDFTGSGSGGWKQAIIGEGDRAGVCNPANPTSATCPTSCTQLEIVANSQGWGRNIFGGYHSCGGKDGAYEPFEYWDSARGNITVQNAVGCLYGSGYPTPPCVGYQANRWMTFQVQVKIGTWYRNDGVYHRDSTVRMWVADEGHPSTLVIDFSPGVHGYDLANTSPATAEYGKVWLLPYQTGKSASVPHATAYMWYDDLIISRNKIADPSGIVPTPTSGTPPTPTPDTTAPTVAIIAPAGGTVSGTITLAASAADNVGVAGVQFTVDGNPVGAEDTAAPYNLSLDTTALSNGSHVIGARARDAAGNAASAAGVGVIVNNVVATPTPTPSVNLVPGGDMEGAPWAARAVQGRPVVSLTTTEKVSGRQSVQVKNGGTTTYQALLQSPRFAVTGKKVYEFSLMAKTESVDNRGVWLRVNWYDAAGRQLSAVEMTGGVSGTTGWTKRTIRLTAPTLARTAAVEVRVKARYGTAWIDDVTATATP